MGRLTGAIWLYPWDLVDEGPEVVLRRVKDDGGLSTIQLAVCYHAGLFLLPHNPRRKMYFPHGAIYYRPDPAVHAGNALQPFVHPMVEEIDPLRAAGEVGARLGVEVAAWIVPTHNTRMGEAHPDCVQVNAFGDRHFPSLCPANSHVRAYARAVARDVARYQPSAIVIESLEYAPMEHGFHHEVIGIALTPLASLLLGLCFCSHCLERARAAGADGETARRAAAEVLEEFFGGRGVAMERSLQPEVLLGLGGGEMVGYLEMRERVVTTLQAEVTEAARGAWHGVLARVDFAPLRPGGVADYRLRCGANVATMRGLVDRQDPTLYSPDAAVIGEQLRAYRETLPSGTALMPALRAIRPQTESREALLAAVRACREGGSTALSFYNYGFMRLETLGWIRDALGAGS